MKRKQSVDLKKVRDLQKVNVERSPDDYSVGIYNGLELALSIIEGREPVFMFPEQSKSGISVIEGHEEKEQLGRTVASGKRICKGNAVDENV